VRNILVGVNGSGLMALLGAWLGTRLTATRAREAWLQSARLEVYARLMKTSGDVLQAVQDASEVPNQEARRLYAWPRYESAIEAQRVAGNEAILLCDRRAYDAITPLVRPSTA